ncbi:hypothetical protein M514_23950 [Trichuris suis]|uniref:Uncharacterized protein n=1 Tax=Trichuris suis TaxID=68888 RepID=A0A085N2V6_9BILA|nr:hypothetical protein M514_23950 [Trichuris suis]
MNVRWLYSTVKDEESAATLLREKGLLHQERPCPSCSDLMQLGRGGKVWRGLGPQCGTHRTSLPLHLCEFMWRKRLASGDDPFEKLLQDIAKLYPPH